MTADKPDWRRLFCAAVAEHGGVLNEIADELGISRTTVSLIANGKYHAKLDKFARRIIETYDRFECPHTGEPITAAACRGYADAKAPTSSAREARHWRACQECPNKPAKEA